MTEYIKIPECTIRSAMSSYRVGIYTFLSTRKQANGAVHFSITSLCDFLGVKPDHHKFKSNYTIYNDLDMMAVFGYFKESPDFEFIKEHERGTKESFEVIPLDTIFNPSGRFAVIGMDEIDSIIKYRDGQSSKVNISHILLLLAYIRININKSRNKPRCCYRLYSSIENDIDLSIYNIKKALSILQELGIITVGESARTCFYNKETGKKSFANPFKIFADSRIYLPDNNSYDPLQEIEKQKLILENKQ